ncbi:hypothetical protein DFH08DRAFT_1083153 [Mycena albidolilacea]|uniref:Uncharacterized protein n=1 Tax=Mycena albidolilacea TaxID=1033008 RepID=A0AAD7EL58_9AGAR|nr:hypothetical protein DFH08DRAFT_1083153 [Mycena albidolilacea]
MLMPPTAIIAGNGPLPVVGYVIIGENVIVLPPFVTVMARILVANDAQRGDLRFTTSQSPVVTTLETSANVNGSGGVFIVTSYVQQLREEEEEAAEMMPPIVAIPNTPMCF